MAFKGPEPEQDDLEVATSSKEPSLPRESEDNSSGKAWMKEAQSYAVSLTDCNGKSPVQLPYPQSLLDVGKDTHKIAAIIAAFLLDSAGGCMLATAIGSKLCRLDNADSVCVFYQTNRCTKNYAHSYCQRQRSTYQHVCVLCYKLLNMNKSHQVVNCDFYARYRKAYFQMKDNSGGKSVNYIFTCEDLPNIKKFVDNELLKKNK